MDFSTLKNISPVYPMYISQFKDIISDPNSDIQTKINSIIDNLNAYGSTSNQLVNNWNQVMQWAMNDGLNSAVVTQMNAIVADGQFQTTLDNISSKVEDIMIDVIVKGAKGDGVTDDTTVVQNVINSMTKGIVYFPPNYTFLTTTLTVSNPNVVLYLNNCTLKTDGITISGANSGIIGNNATIDGKLKVSQTTAQTASGGTVLTFGNGHPFQVGDGIQSSYGLGGDGSNPISVTAITSTTVTVATATTNAIPSGAYIGTFGWSKTVVLSGNGTFLKGVTPYGLQIVNSKGYGLGVSASVAYGDNIFINNNGLDLFQINGTSVFYLSNSKLGFNYDIAKQGMVLGDGSATVQNVKVYLDNVTFNRNNSDPEFYLYSIHNGSEIHAKRCTFIGTGGIHPSPYNGNSWTVVEANMNASSTLFNKIEFHNCTFQDYDQGIVSEQSGATAAQTFGEIEIKYSKGYNVVLGSQLTHSLWNRFDVEECLFDGQNVKTSSTYWLSNGSSTINFKRMKILNDATTKIFSTCLLQDCTFDHANFLLNETTFGERITAIESSINSDPSSDNTSHLRLKDLTLKHSSLTTDVDITNIVNVHPADGGGGGIIDFKLLNGTLRGYIYNNNYKNFYVLDVKLSSSTFNGGYSILYGDDWYIPQNSKIENVTDTTTNRIKYVTKSTITTLSATGTNGSTSVTVASTSGFSVNDYINIALDNGRVHSTTVSAISGNTVTLSVALPSQATNGNNVCDFLY